MKKAWSFTTYAVSAATFMLTACSQDASKPRSPTHLPVAAAADSMAPNISTGADGTILLSWIEPAGDGHALRFSEYGDRAWSSPRVVAQGENWFVNWADFPSVVALTESLWASHWLVSQAAGGYAYNINAALSADSGASWSEVFTPHNDGTETEHGFVSLFPDSAGVGVLWLDGRKMINEYDENDVRASGMTLRAGTFARDTLPVRESLVDDLVCDCCQTDIALTADGPVAIYRNRTTGETRDIYVSRREFGEWQPGVAVSDDDWQIDACPVNGPVIQASGDRVAAVWFTGADDVPLVKAAWSTDAGRTFSDPVTVDSDRPLGHVGATLLPDGDLVVNWLRSDSAGGGNLFVKRISAQGEMGVDVPVDLAADVFAFSVPQIAAHDDELILAWTEENNGVYGIGSALIPLSMVD
ncbi:MAG: sialidase family protein [Woeseiaceae bacterium]